jgi:beta-glucanase (GH16 family)
VTSAPRTPVWADEFEGPAGSRPDPTKWRYDVGASGWGNNEWQNYTDRTANAALDGAGHLDLIARREQLPDAHCEFGPCDITSARLVTQGVFAQRYGRFEARIKLPTGVGMWPAFWMLGDPTSPQCAGDADCGEIDIVEALGSKEPERVWGSAHGPGYSGVEGLTREHLLPGGRAFADDYHVYAVDWAPERLTFSVDGVVYQIRTPADVPGKRWVFDHPYYLLLNLAVGGDWPGPPDAGTPFPIRMSVDYVRVYHQGLT